jgi:hypothetical protein
MNSPSTAALSGNILPPIPYAKLLAALARLLTFIIAFPLVAVAGLMMLLFLWGSVALVITKFILTPSGQKNTTISGNVNQ